jgi:alpha-tubulin suppressor-like RCC1 family protein
LYQNSFINILFFQNMKKTILFLTFAFSFANLDSQQSEIWAWGYNSFAQLGTGDTLNRNSPILIGVTSDWKDITVGDQHSIATKSDGSFWAWGTNGAGQLGDSSNGATLKKLLPSKIGTSNNWKSISAGNGYHNIAIKNDGTLWAWGSNDAGQLGDGTKLKRNIPNQIGASADWKIISAGNSHSMAIKNDGTLWGWGFNGFGGLGDGSGIDRNIPNQIGASTDWKTVSAGYSQTVAIKNDGSLWAWGSNGAGQLGDGTIVYKLSPIRIGNETNWKILASGGQHTVALKHDGTLWTWGYNASGQLGDGTNTTKLFPAQIGFDTNWKEVSAGSTHTLALKNDGTLWTWGSNVSGQLGNGDSTNTNLNVPTKIGNSKDWQKISAGFSHTIAIKGTVTSVESDLNNQLKFTEISNSEITIDLIESNQAILSLFDITGKKIINDINIESNQYKFKINSLSIGAYILVVNINNRNYTYKFIKE